MCCPKEELKRNKERREFCYECDGKGIIKKENGEEDLCNTCGGHGNVSVFVVKIK